MGRFGEEILISGIEYVSSTRISLLDDFGVTHLQNALKALCPPSSQMQLN